MDQDNRFFLKGFILFITIGFLMGHSFSVSYAKDKINVNLIGRWVHSGSIQTVEIVYNTPEDSYQYAYCGTSRGLLIFNISDPNMPKEIAFFEIGEVKDIAFFKMDDGTYKYAALVGHEGLKILDISNPIKPAFTGGYYYNVAWSCSVAVQGDYAFVADYNNGLVIIDCSDPIRPTYTGGYNIDVLARSIAIQGNYAFVMNSYNGIVIIDCSDPTRPTYAGRYDTDGSAEGVAIQGVYAFVADYNNGLVIVNCSDPTRPTYTGRYYTDGYTRGVAVQGDYAFVTDSDNDLVIIDCSNPNVPTYAGGYDINVSPESIAVQGDYAFVTDNYNGLFIIDCSDSTGPTYAGGYDTAGSAEGVAVQGDYAFVADGINGLVIIDCSNPNVPNNVGGYDTDGKAYDVVIQGDYAFVADYNNGLVIVNCSDPTRPTYAGGYDTDGEARGVAIQGNYAFVADGINGLVIIDCSNPNVPTYAGGYDTDGHARGVAIQGNYAFVADGIDGLVIIDCSDPNVPTYAGKWNSDIITGYAHGIAVQEDFAFVADKRHSLFIIDCSDPNVPTYAGGYDTAEWPSDVAIQGDYAFVVDKDDILIFHIVDTLQSQGNLILSLGGPFSEKNPLWPPVKNLANTTYSIFLDQNYSNHFTYYLTPELYQDIDKDGFSDPFEVDDYNPTVTDIDYAITSWAYNRLNIGPLYLYLTGLGTEDAFQIMPGEIIKAGDPYIFEDKFIDNRNNWKEGDYYTYLLQVTDDKYIFENKAQHGLSTYQNIYIAEEDDFMIESTMSKIDGINNNSYDIEWGNEDLNTFYAFGVTGGGDYIYGKWANNDWISIIKWTFSPYINPDNSTNKLAVVKSGNKLQLFVNDHFINEVSYESFSINKIGFAVNDTMKIEIDNIIIIQQNNLKYYLDLFQAGTNRDIICLFEFASSGSFCDNLIDLNTLPYSRTIITCTDPDASYLDLKGEASFTGILLNLLQYSNQPALFENTGISYYERIKLLQGLFSEARELFWVADRPYGYIFRTQPPQMVTAQGPDTLCSISLSVKPSYSTIFDPNNLTITDPSQLVFLTATGHYLDTTQNRILNPDQDIHYHSSDESILLVTQQGEAYANPNTNYNGTAYILGTVIDPNFSQSPNRNPNRPCTDPNHPCLGGVTGRIPIKVSIDGRKEKEDLPKAIILAGRCNDRAGYDYLWESTNKMANHAYHTFIDRGYIPNNICYLSHDPNQKGVDSSIKNGEGYRILEEIFTDPINPHLDLTGLTDLTIFLIDHGKHNKFILGPTDKESLSPLDLDYWLDTIQKDYPDAMITVIIEACQSGYFVEPLTQDTQNRIVITSTQDTTAYLAANGWVSFTYFLFNYLKSGATLGVAFEQAHRDIASLSWGGIQHPILQDNHNRKLASEKLLGGSFILSQDQPYITQVSKFDPNIPILPHTPIDLWAEVTDLDGIDPNGVWAFISASQSSLQFSGSMNDPIVGLPTVPLSYDPNTQRYQGTYIGFSYSGPYTIIFLARDTKGMVSYPRTIHLYVEGSSKDKAYLLYDPNFKDYAEFAEQVLKKRCFPADDISHETLASLGNKLDSLSAPLDHLLIYYISPTPLTKPNAQTLDSQLDHIQQDTHCTVILLMDTPYSGALLEPLTPPEGEKRIIIAGSDPNHQHIIESIRPPFSQFFFSSIYNGVNINQAYHSARFALGFFSDQNPLLDDNGNGQAPDYGLDYDGKFASNVYLGSPFDPVRAGPRITVPRVVHINSWETSTATIWAEVQDPNSFVWALIIPPEGPNDIEVLDYYVPNKERFEKDYAWFTQPGVYTVVVYAQDSEGLLDYDESPYIVLALDPYEKDDASTQARPILVNHTPQTHSFHNPNDTDWIYFYAYKELPYQVKAEREWTDCQLLIEVFDTNLIPIAYSSPYAVGFSVPQDGYYYARTSYTCEMLPASYPSYDLSVVCPSAGYGASGIYGWIRDKVTGEGIERAKICFTKISPQCGYSIDEWWTNDSSYKIGRIEKGFFMIDHLAEGEGTLYVQASDYKPKEFNITVSPNTMKRVICELEIDPTTIVDTLNIDPNKIAKTMKEHLSDIEILNVSLHQGLNLFSYPLDYPDPYYVKEFLYTHDPNGHSTGPEWFSGMRCYNHTNRSEETCYFVPSYQNMSWQLKCSNLENPNGFPIRSDEGYTIYMREEKNIEFCPLCANSTSISLSPSCSNKSIDLKKGINWVGIPSPPPDYTSFIMLREIGTYEEIVSISGYNPIEGQWETTYWEFGKPGGEKFPILSVQGYMVFMKKEKSWLPAEGF